MYLSEITSSKVIVVYHNKHNKTIVVLKVILFL